MRATRWVMCILAAACMISALVAALSILIYSVQGVELHISGSISGSGNQSLFWNGTALNVTAVSA